MFCRIIVKGRRAPVAFTAIAYIGGSGGLGLHEFTRLLGRTRGLVKFLGRKHKAPQAIFADIVIAQVRTVAVLQLDKLAILFVGTSAKSIGFTHEEAYILFEIGNRFLDFFEHLANAGGSIVIGHDPVGHGDTGLFAVVPRTVLFNIAGNAREAAQEVGFRKVALQKNRCRKQLGVILGRPENGQGFEGMVRPAKTERLHDFLFRGSLCRRHILVLAALGKQIHDTLVNQVHQNVDVHAFTVLQIDNAAQRYGPGRILEYVFVVVTTADLQLRILIRKRHLGRSKAALVIGHFPFEVRTRKVKLFVEFGQPDGTSGKEGTLFGNALKSLLADGDRLYRFSGTIHAGTRFRNLARAGLRGTAGLVARVSGAALRRRTALGRRRVVLGIRRTAF